MKEQIKNYLFLRRDLINNALKILIPIGILISVGNFFYYVGYSLDGDEREVSFVIVKGLVLFFLLQFFVKFLFSVHWREFLRTNILESVLILILGYEFFDLYIIDIPGVEEFMRVLSDDPRYYYILFFNVYVLFFAALEFAKWGHFLTNLSIKPSILFVCSFLLLIIFGTILLSLPEMTVDGKGLSFIDALFTSTSATCVTGLIVVDTATFFTLKGKMVILLLMQAGGIGIITFALFLSTFIRKGFGLKSQEAMREYTQASNLANAQQLLMRVIGTTFVIEGIGIFFIYSLWGAGVSFNGNADRAFHSVFHGISAFCNAGFSTFSSGLYTPGVEESYLLHLVVAGLIFLGALGFPAIYDLTNIAKLRDRMKYPWKKWELSTKIAVYTSIILVLTGTVAFFILEQGNSLQNKNLGESIITSIFQSVTTRTAGFNTVAIGELTMPVLVLFIFLMFIGASSASTGGGIKTSTFVVIFIAVIASIKGKKQSELGKKRIGLDLLNRAFSIFVFAASFIMIAVFFLSITEKDLPIFSLVFEEVSAFCTVGLSLGITAELSFWGKMIIIFSMFVGRVGILTLVLSLSTMVETNNYKYPRKDILIG